jgi:hypothetical protein
MKSSILNDYYIDIKNVIEYLYMHLINIYIYI